MKPFDWFDSFEVAVVSIAAGGLLILGPLFIVYCFALAHRHSAALFTGALWLCCVVACIRDFRRRRFSWISGIILLVWLLTTLVLGLVMA